MPVTYNGKTYYYNPETKKLCSDKNGKNPIKTMTGAHSGAGGGSGKNKGSSGSSKSGSTANVYKEYYVTKYTE